MLKAFDHQKVGVKWLLSCRKQAFSGVQQRGAILADDMGLGKSMESLLAAKVHKVENSATKVFVICRKSLISNWKHEAKLWNVQVDAFFSNHVASFPEGHNGPFVVIFDEAHDLQNPESGRTQRFLALCSGKKIVKHEKTHPDGRKEVWEEEVRTGDEAKSVYLLTGTPIKNGRPHNLLPLLQAINHGLVANKKLVKDYLFKYCGPENNGFGWTFNGATNLDELHEIVKPSILRRMTEECIDLPEFTRTFRPVELSKNALAKYESKLAELKASYFARLKAGQINVGGEKLVLMTQLRLAGSVAKVESIIEAAEEVIESGHKVVIFTCFKESANEIAAHFGVKCYDGDASPTQRDKLVNDFQNSDQKVFVGVDKAGGVGLTLHAHGKCRKVFLGDRPWTPGDAQQLEKRAHRIGQTSAVQAVWFQHGVMDTKIDTILQEKAENIEHVLSGERQSMKFLNELEMADVVLEALGW